MLVCIVFSFGGDGYFCFVKNRGWVRGRVENWGFSRERKLGYFLFVEIRWLNRCGVFGLYRF